MAEKFSKIFQNVSAIGCKNSGFMRDLKVQIYHSQAVMFKQRIAE